MWAAIESSCSAAKKKKKKKRLRRRTLEQLAPKTRRGLPQLCTEYIDAVGMSYRWVVSDLVLQNYVVEEYILCQAPSCTA